MYVLFCADLHGYGSGTTMAQVRTQTACMRTSGGDEHMQDIAEALDHAERAGYAEHFDIVDDQLASERARFDVERVTLIDTIPVDGGTDPGDDATVFLVQTDTGLRGHFVVPDSFHVDASRARFIDRLLRRSPAAFVPTRP